MSDYKATEWYGVAKASRRQAESEPDPIPPLAYENARSTAATSSGLGA